MAPNHDPSTLSDEALLRLIADGDRHAFGLLYDRHASIIYGLILRIVRNRTVADDVLQDTFWQLWKRAAEYRGDGRAAAWLYRIARNRSLDALRYRKRTELHTVTALDASNDFSMSQNSGLRQGNPLLQLITASHSTSDTAVAFAQAERRRHVLEGLQSIPPEQRLCLELAYFEGMSQQQIADYANVPLGTVKTRMRMGLAKLEHFLRSQGYRQEDVLP